MSDALTIEDIELHLGRLEQMARQPIIQKPIQPGIVSERVFDIACEKFNLNTPAEKDNFCKQHNIVVDRRAACLTLSSKGDFGW